MFIFLVPFWWIVTLANFQDILKSVVYWFNPPIYLQLLNIAILFKYQYQSEQINWCDIDGDLSLAKNIYINLKCVHFSIDKCWLRNYIWINIHTTLNIIFKASIYVYVVVIATLYNQCITNLYSSTNRQTKWSTTITYSSFTFYLHFICISFTLH